MVRSPIIVAHRGLHDAWPENSKPAFDAAWAAGVRWVECDVHASRDGEIVVIHDPTLERTAYGRGPVAAVDWPELSAIELRSEVPETEGVHIPRLADAVAGMPPSCGIIVEIKPADSAYIVRRTLRTLRGRRAMVQSFDLANCHLARTFDASIPCAVLCDTPERVVAALAQNWPAIHLRHDLIDDAFMQEATRRNIEVGAWTVNAEPDLRRIIGLGVYMVITDEPFLAQRIVME